MCDTFVTGEFRIQKIFSFLKIFLCFLVCLSVVFPFQWNLHKSSDDVCFKRIEFLNFNKIQFNLKCKFKSKKKQKPCCGQQREQLNLLNIHGEQ